MITWTQAFNLYKTYKTQTQQYKEFAAHHGYTVGDLNARFAVQLHAH
jgi:hypothetical protein